MRGDRKKREQKKAQAEITPGIENIDIAEYQPVRIPSPLWRDCIKKVWEIDPSLLAHSFSILYFMGIFSKKKEKVSTGNLNNLRNYLIVPSS